MGSAGTERACTGHEDSGRCPTDRRHRPAVLDGGAHVGDRCTLRAVRTESGPAPRSSASPQISPGRMMRSIPALAATALALALPAAADAATVGTTTVHS